MTEEPPLVEGGVVDDVGSTRGALILRNRINFVIGLTAPSGMLVLALAGPLAAAVSGPPREPGDQFADAALVTLLWTLSVWFLARAWYPRVVVRGSLLEVCNPLTRWRFDVRALESWTTQDLQTPVAVVSGRPIKLYALTRSSSVTLHNSKPLDRRVDAALSDARKAAGAGSGRAELMLASRRRPTLLETTFFLAWLAIFALVCLA